MTKQLRRWAFTVFRDLDEGEDVAIEEIKKTLKVFCSAWVFQLEEGTESHRKHLQGRCSFKQSRRLTELSKIFVAHWSPEHDTEAGDFYATKEESRLNGPWSDKDEKKPMPWDLEKIKAWKPWQLEIFKSLTERDDRIINVLYDPIGGIGKSKVFKHILWNKLGGLIPIVGDAKDIIQACCSMGAKKGYVLDMPRSGEGKAHMMSIYKAVEQIKNGVVMDFRYKYTELIMGSPVVWIFTNEVPDMSMLSMDRWRLWKVDDSESLVRM